MYNQTRINKESIRDQSGSNTNFPTTYMGPTILRRTKGMPTQLKPLYALAARTSADVAWPDTDLRMVQEDSQ